MLRKVATGRRADNVNQTGRLQTTPCTPGRRRRCKGLAYSSQGESASDRALRRANRIRKQLGWPAGVAHGHGPKPGGMHQTTFDRLRLRHDKLVNIWVQGTAKWLGLV